MIVCSVLREEWSVTRNKWYVKYNCIIEWIINRMGRDGMKCRYLCFELDNRLIKNVSLYFYNLLEV